jgi:hypothetical protein
MYASTSSFKAKDYKNMQKLFQSADSTRQQSSFHSLCTKIYSMGCVATNVLSSRTDRSENQSGLSNFHPSVESDRGIYDSGVWRTQRRSSGMSGHSLGKITTIMSL